MNELYRVDWMDGTANYLNEEAYNYLRNELKEYAADETDRFIEFVTVHGTTITAWLSHVHNLSYSTKAMRVEEYELSHAIGEEANELRPKKWE